MAHQTSIKVRGYHLDVYQHVNNARYLEFLEEARWCYLEERGDVAWFEAHHLAWVIVNININYRQAATIGQELIIQTEFAKFGGKSAVIQQQIMLAGTVQLIADAAITFVCLDQRSGKPMPIEGELLARLQSAS